MTPDNMPAPDFTVQAYLATTSQPGFSTAIRSNYSSQLHKYLDDYLSSTGRSRDELAAALAERLNSEPDLAYAVLDGTLPSSEIDAELLDAIAQVVGQNVSFIYRTLKYLAPATLSPAHILPPQTVIGRRYQLLALLGTGGAGQVYRALDRLAGREIALKRIIAPTHFSIPSDEKLLEWNLLQAQEFRILNSLHHPNIISVLDYGFDDQRYPYFTMELLEHPRTILEAGEGIDLAGQINLLEQLLRALAYLHRFGLVHRDLKPANILVTGSLVKVLDFGLTVFNNQPTGLAGTLKWMAPEVLRGMAAGTASDLYAVGILAYQLFTTRYPFPETTPEELLAAILNQAPDLSPPGVPERLTEILRRLLAKMPEERYSDAHHVIADLYQAINLQPPRETLEVRESFLQAARLVGRKTELAAFERALKTAMQRTGSAWLVGGESGVGKSRLLTELRSIALAQGMLVLQGQSVANGRRPYHLWLDLLPQLALLTDLDEYDLAVLKRIEPRVSVVHATPVPDAPDLDPQSMHMRLAAVMTTAFSRLIQPVLLLLEDLQWASDESLAILGQLLSVVQDLPLVIVASYRDDERPGLPALLPRMQTLKIHRLGTREVAELSKAILGSAGRQPEVINLLLQETEGNAFFVIEVARALVEESGGLDQIGNITLPDHVFSEGIQRIIQRRLDLPGPQARPMLHAAAVGGNSLDLAVLQAIDPGLDIERWLSDCANTVLQVQGGTWRFAHDKLRNALLAEISGEAQQRLHQQIAETIERLYGDGPEHLASLAYHWGEAAAHPTIHIELLQKAVAFLEKAGAYALNNYANQDAVRFLSQASALETRLGDSAERFARAQRDYLTGQAYLQIGKLGESQRHVLKSLELLGHPMPTGTIRLVSRLFGQIVWQSRRRLSRFQVSPVKPEKQQILMAAARSYMALADTYIFSNQALSATYAVIGGLNLAEQASEPSAEMAWGYAMLTYLVGANRLHFLAENYARLATENTPPNNSGVSARVAQTVGAYAIGMARWARAEEAHWQAIEISRRVGDWRGWGLSSAGLIGIALFRGQFTHALRLSNELVEVAQQSNDIQLRIWGMDGQGESLLRLGRTTEALTVLERSTILLANSTDQIERASHFGIYALAALRNNDWESANRFADQTLNLLSQLPTVWSVIVPASAIAEVYLSLWEYSRDRTDLDPTTCREQFSRAFRILNNYAHRFPVAQPRVALYQGLYDWLTDRPIRAFEAWRKCLTRARQLDMPYEQGYAYFEMGRHLPEHLPSRRSCLTQACTFFARSGMTFELRRAQDEGQAEDSSSLH